MEQSERIVKSALFHRVLRVCAARLRVVVLFFSRAFAPRCGRSGAPHRGAHGLACAGPPPFVGNRSHHDPFFQYNLYVYLIIPPLNPVKLCYVDFRPAPTYSHAMDLSPFNYTKWTDRLAFDMALLLEGSGEDMKEIMSRHRVSPDDMLVFKQDPTFLKKVSHYRDEIREKGLTFRLKARAQAEELLVTSWTLIHSPDVSASVKADLIKQTVKWGGLEPKDSVDAAMGGGGVRITINLNGPASPTEEPSQDEYEQIDYSEEITDVEFDPVEPA